jgi:hypothetical protein
MLAAVTAMAQEKMKDPPKSGHEGMAKPAAAQCDAAVIAKATSVAPADMVATPWSWARAPTAR